MINFFRMRKNILKILVSAGAAVFCFALAGFAEAATFHDGPLVLTLPDGKLFSVADAVPGESFESQISVQNTGGKTRRFQFELNVKTDPVALGDHLFLKVEDGAGNCLWGCGGDKTLNSLDGKEFVVKKIPGHSTKIFKFILTFDVNAGNEFQSASTSFDVKLGYKGKRPDGNGNGGGPGGAGIAPPGIMGGLLAAVTGGVAGEAMVAEEGAPEEQVEGAETGPEEGEVMGEEVSLCQSWPMWIWILALLIYFAAFSWRTFDKFKEQVEKREIRWKWQAALAVAAFLIWYFFDFCREYLWFVILVIIGGAAVYLVYLYLFRREIREKSEKIETGEK